MTARYWASAAAALALAPAAAQAQSETRASADVGASLGYASNPFLARGGDQGSALASVDLAPRLELLTARQTLVVSGDANLQQYFRGFGRNDSYSGSVDFTARPSERVTTHWRFNASDSVLGAYNSYLPATTASVVPSAGLTTGADALSAAAGSATIVTPLTDVGAFVPTTDVGVYGLRARRRDATLSGDLSLALSARDTFAASGYASVERYNALLLGNYEAYNGGARYSRAISAGVTLGLRGSVSVYDYRQRAADSRVYSIEATGTAQLSQRWSVDGALGGSTVDSSGPGSTRETSLSGSLNLCRKGQETTGCLFASRGVSPTAIEGSQYFTTVGVSYFQRLDRHQNISFGAGYSHLGGGRTNLLFGGVPSVSDVVQASAGYNRQLGERLRLTATANYQQLLGSAAGHVDDIGGSLGLAYRIGDKR